MVQFNKGSKDPRDEAWGRFSSALGGGIGKGLNTYFANKALDEVLEDETLKDATLSERWEKLNSSVSMYGENGQRLLKNRLQTEMQRDQEKTAKEIEKSNLEKEKRLFEHQRALQADKDKAALERENLKPPVGGITGQPIPTEIQSKISQIVKDSENLNADELELKMGDAGIPTTYSAPYIQNRRDQDKTNAKVNVEREKIANEHDIKFHQESSDYEKTINKEYRTAKKQLETIQDVKQALASNKITPSSLSNIFKGFGSIGDKISNALLNKNQAVLQSAIPEFLEGRKELFGVRLSDADLRLLQDKLPDIGKSKEVNEQILNIMEKYAQRSILKKKAAENVLEREGVNTKSGKLRPLNYENKVEAEFEKLVDEKNKSSSFNELPSVSDFKSGTIMKNSSTGERMISNGKEWLPA